MPAPPRRSTPRRSSTRPSTDRKSTRLNSSHARISYAVFCLKKDTNKPTGARNYATRKTMGRPANLKRGDTDSTQDALRLHVTVILQPPNRDLFFFFKEAAPPEFTPFSQHEPLPV